MEEQSILDLEPIRNIAPTLFIHVQCPLRNRNVISLKMFRNVNCTKRVY